MIEWKDEVEKRRNQLINDTQEFLKIKSVLTEDTSEQAPFGIGIKQALEYALEKCKAFGMTTKNLDGYAGHAEIGQGDEIIGILCHVDVVPEGEGWSSDPYGAEIRDGKIFARGAIDDKGPTMSAIYAMSIIKELGLNLNKRVRIIFGTDEESNWRGVHYYFEKEEMPTMGFAPDADFPIIVAEKGIVNITIEGHDNQERDEREEFIKLASFSAGKRSNMVPDFAKTILNGNEKELSILKQRFEDFLINYSLGGVATLTNQQLHIELKGISAHGMEPHKGINAGLELIHFLQTQEEMLNVKSWISWANESLYNDYNGKKLGIAYKDEITGPLTVNPGVINYENGRFQTILNIRYPVTTQYEEMIEKIKININNEGLKIADISNSKPHHVDENHILVKTLQSVYEEQVGEKATLISIGGGTYARALTSGVAFGPLFPGKIETAHQKDEYFEVDDLIKATSIYAQAIYELAK